MKRNVCNNLCINLGKQCNLLCPWCYQQNSKTRQLDINVFEDFYSSIVKGNFDRISLIGGEPTVYPHLKELINILHEQKIYLNTNGLMFSDYRFCDTLLSQIESMTISLKGYDRDSFLCETRVDMFTQLQEAICNLQNIHMDILYTYNCTKILDEKQCDLLIDFLCKNNIRKIVLHDVRPYIDNKGKLQKVDTTRSLQKIAAKLRSTSLKVYVRLNQPFCNYDKDFIQDLWESGMLVSTCAVKKRNSIFMSSELDLIPCNELEIIKFGTYRKDFNSYADVRKLLSSKPVSEFYNRLAGAPTEKCRECNYWKLCGGSCILHWV